MWGKRYLRLGSSHDFETNEQLIDDRPRSEGRHLVEAIPRKMPHPDGLETCGPIGGAVDVTRIGRDPLRMLNTLIPQQGPLSPPPVLPSSSPRPTLSASLSRDIAACK